MEYLCTHTKEDGLVCTTVLKNNGAFPLWQQLHNKATQNLLGQGAAIAFIFPVSVVFIMPQFVHVYICFAGVARLPVAEVCLVPSPALQ